jgi:hypothetical protein
MACFIAPESKKTALNHMIWRGFFGEMTTQGRQPDARSTTARKSAIVRNASSHCQNIGICDKI